MPTPNPATPGADSGPAIQPLGGAGSRRSVADLLRAYNALLENDPDRTVRDMRMMGVQLSRRGVHINGVLAQTFLKPDLISFEEHDLLATAVPGLLDCIERALAIYQQQPDLRPLFGVDPAVRELIDSEPPVSGRTVILARLDGFLNRGALSIIEFNVDSPAGPGYADVIEDLLLESETWREFTAGGFRVRRTPRRQLVMEALLEYYANWRAATGADRPETPTIAITDWTGVATAAEFGMLRLFFERHGLDTIVCDPREFRFDGSRLHARGKAIDLVYRRVLVPELAARRDEVPALLEAIGKQAVCVANPLHSRIASGKSLMELLTDPLFDGLFTDEQNALRRLVLPWTRRVSERRVEFEGEAWALPQLLRERRSDFVLKPCAGYRGIGVVLGCDTDDVAWSRAVDTALRRGDIVAQKLVPIPEKYLPVAHMPARRESASGRIAEVDAALANRIRLVPRKANLGPFAFGGRYGGAVARVARGGVINASSGGGVIPTIAIGF